MLVELSGQIERITYTNEENGYTIAKIKLHGQRELLQPYGLNTYIINGMEVVLLTGEGRSVNSGHAPWGPSGIIHREFRPVSWCR